MTTTKPPRNAAQMLALLKDIAEHLEQGGHVYAGSLIFEEDAPALDVIKRAIAKAERS